MREVIVRQISSGNVVKHAMADELCIASSETRVRTVACPVSSWLEGAKITPTTLGLHLANLFVCNMKRTAKHTASFKQHFGAWIFQHIFINKTQCSISTKHRENHNLVFVKQWYWKIVSNFIDLNMLQSTGRYSPLHISCFCIGVI